jgi:leucyl aminopeptidase (aminopeptidase T)
VTTNDSQATEILSAARIIITYCMKVKSGESILIVVDEPSIGVAEPFMTVAKGLGLETVMVAYPAMSRSSEEPPETVAAAMLAAKVILAPTSKSISHTMARKAATEAGARMASMPGFDLDIMARTINIDYDKLGRLSEAVADVMRRGQNVRLTCPRGSDLLFSIAGQEWFADDGDYSQPHNFGNLPAGEACASPVEGTANGTVVIDGSVGGLDFLGTELRLTVRDGMLMDAEGPAANLFLESLDVAGPSGRNMAELGIGTNPNARLSGCILEDEKILGTVHVAFGNNLAFGGKVAAHIHRDGLVIKPTLVVDSTTEVLKDGNLLIN